MEANRTPRMTIPTQLVLRALLADPAQELYGVEIGTEAGLPSGTVHPILARLEAVGWVTSRWEEMYPRTGGRPPRPHRSPPSWARWGMWEWPPPAGKKIAPRSEAPPPRRYYRLTPDGLELARA